MTDAANSVEFTKNQALVKNNNEKTILIADRVGNLYFLRESHEVNLCSTSKENKNSQMMMWHRRLEHVNCDDILEIDRKKIVRDLDLGPIIVNEPKQIKYLNIHSDQERTSRKEKRYFELDFEENNEDWRAK